MEKRIAIMRTSCIHATAEGKCNYTDGLDMKCHGDTCSAYEREPYSYTHCVTKSLHHPKWNHEWQQPESPEPVYILNGRYIPPVTIGLWSRHMYATDAYFRAYNSCRLSDLFTPKSCVEYWCTSCSVRHLCPLHDWAIQSMDTFIVEDELLVPEQEYSMSWFQDNIGGCEFDYYIGCELCNKDCPNRQKECEELTDNDHYYNA